VVAEVSLTVRESDVILSQPVGLTVNPGDAATFSVTAAGVDLGYQWRRNGTAISGATAASFTISSASESGKYDVLVTHAFGSSLSEPATLEVRTPATIERSPASTALAKGTTATLLVKASGTEPLSYQWRLNGVDLPSQTNRKVVVSEAGVYDVVVSNVAGKTVSEPATVSVAELVEITVQPPLATVARSGEVVSFSVVATGTPVIGSSALGYQWYKTSGSSVVKLSNGGIVSGATSSKLTRIRVRRGGIMWRFRGRRTRRVLCRLSYR
jgi:hypothetical protein